MAISIDHALTVEKLPLYHQDPFDRILIAQAISENLIIVARVTKLCQRLIASLIFMKSKLLNADYRITFLNELMSSIRRHVAQL